MSVLLYLISHDCILLGLVFDAVYVKTDEVASTG